MEIAAIIPARGGSKGLPRKNLLPLCGHPLIAYSILAAQNSRTVQRIIVNTDDPEIAQIALRYGAEVPFIRPATLASDNSTDLEVFQHALEWHKQQENYRPDLIVHLRPTSPLRRSTWIDEAVQSMHILHADALRAVTPSPYTPYKMWKIQEDQGSLVPLLTLPEIEEPYNAPRQSLPQTYWQTGTLDIIKPAVIENGSMSGNKIIPFIIDQKYIADIDAQQDLESAEKKIMQLDCLRFDG